MKTGVMIGVSAGAGAIVGVASYPWLLGPPTKPEGEIRESLVYTRFPFTDTWWNHLSGNEVRVTDLQEWQGASAVWRGLFRNGGWVDGTGYPVVVIRIKRESQFFKAPTDVALPPGFSLYYDDPVRDVRIVTVLSKCTHLCCYPGWHVVTDPPPPRDYATYGVDPPTYTQFGQDPIYCACHASQYDPMVLVVNVNGKNGAQYVGAVRVHGPAPRALPVVPVKAVGDTLIGGMPDPRWYEYC